MNDKSKKIFGGLVLAALLAAGCGQKRVMNSDVPNDELGSGSATKAHHNALGKYVVKEHDTLWAIAGRKSVYGDSFEWPLIFKANRDEIKDPDLIYPKQNFKIEKKVPEVELERAKKEADKTPKYVPHSTPSGKNSVDYF